MTRLTLSNALKEPGRPSIQVSTLAPHPRYSLYPRPYPERLENLRLRPVQGRSKRT